MGSSASWGPVPALPLTNWVNLNKSLYLPESLLSKMGFCGNEMGGYKRFVTCARGGRPVLCNSCPSVKVTWSCPRVPQAS